MYTGDVMAHGWSDESFIAVYLPTRRKTYVHVLASKVEAGAVIYYVLSLGKRDDEFVTLESNLRRLS